MQIDLHACGRIDLDDVITCAGVDLALAGIQRHVFGIDVKHVIAAPGIEPVGARAADQDIVAVFGGTRFSVQYSIANAEASASEGPAMAMKATQNRKSPLLRSSRSTFRSLMEQPLPILSMMTLAPA